MGRALTRWRRWRRRLIRFWRNSCRPCLVWRNLPYFLLLILVGFLLTSSLLGRNSPGAATPVVQPPEGAVIQSDSSALRLGQSTDELAQAWSNMVGSAPVVADLKPDDTTPFSLPCDDGRLCTGRGWRKDDQGVWIYHRGVDLQVDTGSDVRAITGGVVTRVAACDEGGTLVEIQHGEGWQSVYGRLEGVGLKAGDKVTRGQILGQTNGNMLHFEILQDGSPLDPMLVMPGLG